MKYDDMWEDSMPIRISPVKPSFELAAALNHTATISPTVREFPTGANRDSDLGKPDYEGCLSPLVLASFARYMESKTHLPNGKTRESDNWQKGMPRESYMKSLFRHFVSVWSIHRGWTDRDGLEEELNAMLFNLQGYFHETLKEAR